MKKLLLFSVMFVLVLCGVFGQTRQENRWIIGRWAGEGSSSGNIEIVFNDNGTGRWTGESDSRRGGGGGRGPQSSRTEDILFSINGNSLVFFSDSGTAISRNATIHRISDQRMVLIINDEAINLQKR